MNEKENEMKLLRILLVIMMNALLVSSIASAADFDWIKDFNIQVQADPSGFRASLGARFQVGDVEINAVLGNVAQSADAYMLFRLGEMSNQPISRVVEIYKAEKGKGWGSLAQSLGIKPGSKEFQALKQGQDLYNVKERDKTGAQDKSKGSGRK
jgi:hypothetical protein